VIWDQSINKYQPLCFYMEMYGKTWQLVCRHSARLCSAILGCYTAITEVVAKPMPCCAVSATPNCTIYSPGTAWCLPCWLTCTKSRIVEPRYTLTVLPFGTCTRSNPKSVCSGVMYRHSWMVRADDSDAFLNHSLKPRSMSNCGFIDTRNGTVCALTKLGLGFQQSPAIQQDTEVAQVRALRRRLRKLGLHIAGPDPDYQRKFPFVIEPLQPPPPPRGPPGLIS
jgi:hypothetical protein